MPIAIDPEELIVGNRTPDMRAGVVFPEAGISWLDEEIETLPTRPQDTFSVRDQDIRDFRGIILPYWQGRTLEEAIYWQHGPAIKAIAKVVKINQRDHAQGHICPNVKKWLRFGPKELLGQARTKLDGADSEKKDFYRGVCLVLEGAISFIRRYAVLAKQLAETETIEAVSSNLRLVSDVCRRLAEGPPGSFHEAPQSVWFLFVILHMESNASSFSPGRMDQYHYPY